MFMTVFNFLMTNFCRTKGVGSGFELLILILTDPYQYHS